MGLPTLPKIYNTYFVAMVATSGGMLFGFDISSMSAIILSDQYNDYFNTPSGITQGAIGSALAAGSVVGSIVAGPISNKIGRRDSNMFAACWWLVGTAVGITSSQVPLYLAEIAMKERRASLVITQQLAIGPASFRTAWEEITQTLAAERQAGGGWRKFIYNGMWKRTLAGFTIQMWQQNAGANVMTYYVVYMFAMAGLSALFIVFTTIIFFYIDNTGRRPRLTYGALAMGACHLVVGGLLSAGKIIPGGVDGNPNIPILLTGAKANTIISFCYLLIFVYALTFAPICWIYAAEVWSLETRATSMGIASLDNWLFNFALGLYIPPGLQNIKYGIFIVFGVMCVLAAVQFYFTYPETCNKSLEEIEDMFAPGGPNAWHTRPGESRLDRLVEEARNRRYTVDDVQGHQAGSITDAPIRAGKSQ
ncbi:hypothetical protein LTS08_007190 [Lithohypha guttulata]|uniref:Major facilitator superfamily (MFS) profile domain-containing protein n=1 Tax=Lithohypha guttulata TaxID=1690604 RepID=A0AAN7T1Y0_9EURO|nr:hypothetical protein LTR05_003945 [Lithohypha guttulata]KAK5097169.1 hypothetical protein LTS08_007190 [Lithohypha guttulata]